MLLTSLTFCIIYVFNNYKNIIEQIKMYIFTNKNTDIYSIIIEDECITGDRWIIKYKKIIYK